MRRVKIVTCVINPEEITKIIVLEDTETVLRHCFKSTPFFQPAVVKAVTKRPQRAPYRQLVIAFNGNLTDTRVDFRAANSC
ncbi:MAG: hypothetical protein SR3Q1_09580 [Quinella sp. 3Q1]|nr:hypothetical protein [Quinella sp. 3Q1]